jgi:hypothetical protein
LGGDVEESLALEISASQNSVQKSQVDEETISTYRDIQLNAYAGKPMDNHFK